MTNNELSGMDLLNDVLFGKGWGRCLPDGGVILLAGIIETQAVSLDDLDTWLRGAHSDGLGLGSAVWDPLKPWTDEELRSLDEQFAGTPFDSTDDVRTAVEVMAEEAALRAARLQELSEFASALGVPTVSTYRDLLAFLIACAVVRVDDDGCYFVYQKAPLPVEVLLLAAAEAKTQDEMRWERLHERFAQSIIRLFKSDEPERQDAISTSLKQLAEQIEADVESAREGTLMLIGEGDFSASVDVARVEPTDEFDLIVDWDAFHSTRIHISHGTSDESEDT